MNCFKNTACAFGLVAAALFSSQVFASENPKTFSLAEQDFLTVGTVTITPSMIVMPAISPCLQMLTNCPATVPAATSPPTSIGDIIAIGQNIWKIVQAGKPTAHIVSNSVSALPRENPNWTLMTGWQGPLIKGYHMEVLNKLGMKMVSMDYKIMAYYGGKFKGKGQYITNLTMITDNVSVGWGYDLQATAELMDLVNTANEDEPVPGCTMQMKWKIDTVLAHREGTHTLFVKGDGTVKELN